MARRVGWIAVTVATAVGLIRQGGTDDRGLYVVALILVVAALAAIAARAAPSSRSNVVVLAAGIGVVLGGAFLPTLEARGFVVLVAGWAALFVTLALARSRSGVRLWLGFLLVVGVAEAAFGLLQYALDAGVGATGTLVNRNHYAGLLNMILPLAVAGIVVPSWESRSKRTAGGRRSHLAPLLLLSAAALLGSAIVLSGSRAGLLTLLGSLTLIVWVTAERSRSAALAPALLGVALLVAALLGWGQVGERFAQLDEEVRRPQLHQDTLRLVVDHPLAGVGPGMYRWQFRPYQTIHLHKRVDHAHNDYLETAAEWGLPVALLFWAFVVRRLLGALRLARGAESPWRRRAALACGGGIATILLHSLVDFNLQIPVNTMVFASLLAVSWNLERGVRPRQRRSRAHPRLSSAVSWLAAASLVLFGWQVGRRLIAQELGNDARSEPSLERALQWDPNEPHLHYRLARSQRDHPALGDFESSERHLREALRLNPRNWKYWRELALLLELSGREAEALEAFERALAVDPRSATLHWQIGHFHLRRSDLEAAREHLRIALWAEPGLWLPGLRLVRAVGARPEFLEEIWPTDAEARLFLLESLLESAEGPEWGALRERLWSSLLYEEAPPPMDRAAAYVLELMRAGKDDGARREWARLNQRHGRLDASFTDLGNRVWNGDFELALADVEPGWRVGKEPRSLDAARGAGYRSAHSLGVSLDRHRPADSRRLDQRLAVHPGRWRLTAAARAESLAAGCDPRLVVVAPDPRRRLAQLELPLDRSWRRAEATFETAVADRELILRLVTPESCESGRLWVDAITVSAEVDSRP